MRQIHSYPKIYALGHKAIQGIFDGEVSVTEKVDGSQFSFQKDAENNVLFRSKGAVINPECPPNLFAGAVAHVMGVQDKLIPEAVYRGEVLQKPKHNALAYDRIPKNHIALFDVEVANQQFLHYETVSACASGLDIDCVPKLFQGTVNNVEELFELLKVKSFLGGQIVEGVIVKNYSVFVDLAGQHTVAMGKLVREEFKELNDKHWRAENPSQKDFIADLVETYRTPARWTKAVQHLTEAGKLEGAPQDVGKLIAEIVRDVKSEYEDEIREALFKHFWKKIGAGVHRGVADWYKERLVQEAFKPSLSSELV